MAYPSGLYRFNITASTIGGEQIVHTVWMRRDGTGALDPTGLQSLADRVRDRWTETVNGGSGMPAGLAAHLYTATEYQKVSAYSVDSAGRATAQAESSFATGVKGTATAALPAQCALVTTLLTAQPGRSGRGRLYLGGLGVSLLTASGRADFTKVGAIADAMGGFYTRLRNDTLQNDTFRPVVVSPTKTASYKITSVAVGDVIDTMRSRRNGLVENKDSTVVDAT